MNSTQKTFRTGAVAGVVVSAGVLFLVKKYADGILDATIATATKARKVKK